MKDEKQRFVVRVDANIAEEFKISLIRRKETAQDVLMRYVNNYIEETENIIKDGKLK